MNVIIARENEVLNQSARAIFDNHQCNFTKKAYYPLLIISLHFFQFAQSISTYNTRSVENG